MSFERPHTGMDYSPCTYGVSRLVFRGPRAATDGPYVAMIGGSETYGKYIEVPFPSRVEHLTGQRVLNLGVMNAGIDVFARDEALMPIISGAGTVILQVMGAANISNRFYSVHPRRNDRFLRHSILLETLFQDVDFTDFAFTRHLLGALRECSPVKFAMILEELQQAWLGRMRLLLSRIPGRKIILWIENSAGGELGPEPLFITETMMQDLEPHIDKLVHCDIGADQSIDQLDQMIFPLTERESALRSMSDAAHERVARALARSIGRWDNSRDARKNAAPGDRVSKRAG
ncbi:MAG: DUF6473 family protein [Jannaschia sp.]